jgi:hypothetical protein
MIGCVNDWLRCTLVAFLLPILGWLALFAWDTDRTHGGPWSPWQVILYVLLLIGVGLWVSRQRPVITILLIPATVTICWSVSVQSWPVDPDSGGDDGLWVVGALFLFIGLLLGSGLIEIIGAVVRAGRTPRPTPPGWYPDPTDIAPWRWWDGVTWTERTG